MTRPPIEQLETMRYLSLAVTASATIAFVIAPDHGWLTALDAMIIGFTLATTIYVTWAIRAETALQYSLIEYEEELRRSMLMTRHLEHLCQNLTEKLVRGTTEDVAPR
jgi:hypothetical protein